MVGLIALDLVGIEKNKMDRLRLNESRGGNFILKAYNIVNEETTTSCSYNDIKRNHMGFRWNGLNSQDARSRDNYALRWAARYGHLDVVKWLVSTFNLNADDVRSWNNWALRWAAERGHLDVVKYLCEITGDTVSRWIKI